MAKEKHTFVLLKHETPTNTTTNRFYGNKHTKLALLCSKKDLTRLLAMYVTTCACAINQSTSHSRPTVNGLQENSVQVRAQFMAMAAKVLLRNGKHLTVFRVKISALRVATSHFYYDNY